MRLSRILLVTVALPLVACFTCTTDNQVKSQGPQGWSEAQKVAWYTASQGSRLVPKSWLHALDRADQATPFLAQASITRYHYLPSPAAGWKAPSGTPAGCEYDASLPLGFTLDCQSDKDLGVTKLRWMSGQTDKEPWVGMNCSACHTTAVNYKGKSAWIDGGPTMADFQSFTEDLNSALKAASTDDAKFAAFSAKVLGPQPAAGDQQMLRTALQYRRGDRRVRRHQHRPRSRPGRLQDQRADRYADPDGSAAARTPAAGLAEGLPAVRQGQGRQGRDALQDPLRGLPCPAGRQVQYRRQIYGKTVAGLLLRKTANPVQTDFWMACNAILDRAKTGRFRGTPASVVSGAPLQDNSDNLGLLKVAAVGTILGQKGNVVAGGFEALFGINRGLPKPELKGLAALSPKQRRANACMEAMMNPTPDNNGDGIVYKGRPLQGVWATAPYLHNGSVPTLYDLLLPPARRPAQFYVGSHEFDPVKVGFVTDKSDDNSFLFDTSVEGNSNGGHDYDNAGLTDEDRWALVEYMKSK